MIIFRRNNTVKEYIKPEMEVTRFEAEDIITTSGNNEFNGDENGGDAVFDP